MHAEAYRWIADNATEAPVAVLDIGGRNVNGSPRALFPAADPYRVLDILPGDGVDIVADAAEWIPDRAYDVVVCAEVFEHTDVWPQIVVTAYAALRPGGRVILTMAGPGRGAHSAVDGAWTLYPGEYYANVDPAELEAAMKDVGFRDVVVDFQPGPADVRATGVR